MDKYDRFGNLVDFNLFGDYIYGVNRMLSIIYRPCIPTERTEFTENKCLVNDIKNQKELDSKFNNSKNYVGEAEFTIMLNKQIF